MRQTVVMPSLYSHQSRAASAALLVTVGLALAACSSSSPPKTPSTTPTHTTAPATSAPATSPAAASEPATGSAALTAIEANWATFFNAKTPTAKRLTLLENGTEFASVIKAQSGGGLASEASSKVTHVTLTGTDQAAVTYAILVAGKVALSNQHGLAVYQGGVWKVGDTSFCALLKLEGTSVAACKS
jgi:hypothetical protein